MHRDGTVPSRNKHRDGTVPSGKKHRDSTVPSRKKHHDGTVPSPKKHRDGTVENPTGNFHMTHIIQNSHTSSARSTFCAKSTKSEKCKGKRQIAQQK